MKGIEWRVEVKDAMEVAGGVSVGKCFRVVGGTDQRSELLEIMTEDDREAKLSEVCLEDASVGNKTVEVS